MKAIKWFIHNFLEYIKTLLCVYGILLIIISILQLMGYKELTYNDCEILLVYAFVIPAIFLLVEFAIKTIFLNINKKDKK